MHKINESTLTKKIAEVSIPSNLGLKNTLGPITSLMERLGYPERGFPSVHVGGTSGKGSTATFIANILRKSGYKVGLFTKPHLSSVRERLVINGCPIQAAEMLELIEGMVSKLSVKPTWFELMTALAFQYFKEEKVDLGVIEVGLGGMYDATNVLRPNLGVLTNVGLDHTEILGDTVEKIAADKVGIIKPGMQVVSGVNQPSVIEVVEEQCRCTKSGLKLLERDFNCSNVVLSTSRSQFNYSALQAQIPGLVVPVLGSHQVINATLAVSAALTLRDEGYHVTEMAVREGLSKTQIPGRMEILSTHPVLMLDCAHSPPKMIMLAEALQSLFPKKRITGVLAFSQGHDAEATLSVLAPLLSRAILTSFNAISDYGSRYAQPPEALAKLLAERFPAVERHIETDPFIAVDFAKKEADPEDLICVTGSIFLVGQIRSTIEPPQLA